ncbi:MAG: type II toxin-antitoxin system VapC family toxin [Betaproteobacteria bacterium]
MSILLDTNVLCEALRRTPAPAVLAWFASRRVDALVVSAVTQAEMYLGARLLPAGKRRLNLQHALDGLFSADFAGRVLPFDGGAVVHHIDVVASRRLAGRPISQFDAQIAAIALRHGASLATRNVRDFEGCGLALIDPWA